MAADLASGPSSGSFDSVVSSQIPALQRPQLDINRLMERVQSLEQSFRQLQVDQKERKNGWDSQYLRSIERQLGISSPRSPLCAYSTLQKKPVPSVFQMPLHYPRYKRVDYETMPEWKLDRLLEEYGLPLLGNLREKREYAMGTFIWRDQRD